MAKRSRLPGHRVLLLLAAMAWASSAPAATPEQVARLVREIKPVSSELKWQQIPWLLDLNEGIRQARREGRPLLLWGSDDDPLERC